MTKSVRRWALVVALSAAAVGVVPSSRTATAQDAPVPQQVATVEQLKHDAFAALKSGKFQQSNELLARAASLSEDPSLQQMASWVKQFESQRQEFAAERHKQFDKAVGDVKKLIANKHESYALDAAARASLLADDKKAFRAEPWVDQLVKQTIAMADQYDKDEQWLKAMRLYADLSSIEPATPEWKDKLKLATRRIRLLALYTPGGIKALQESESKERDAVDALLNPTTQPATKKADKDDEQNDAFKIDWKETVKGVRSDMLVDALKHARSNYYRPVEYKDLLIGGVKGLRAIATTKGLEQTFPGLADQAKREQFIKQLDLRMVDAQNAGTDQIVVDNLIAKIRSDIRNTVDIQEEVWLSEFADGAFAELDPFSSMIWPTDLEEFNKTTQGEFSGVGIQIQTDEDGSLKVVSPLEDSPAYKAGIKAGDIIARIDGKNAKGITLNQAVKTITGKSGTTVMLTVRSPGGVVKDYNIERKTIKVASIKGWLHRPGGGWDYFVDRDNKIAYLRLTNFTKSTTEELGKAADELKAKGAKAMILDLRYNPGGLLSAATEVSDKFLQDGLIVSTRPDRDGTPNSPTFAAAERTDDEIALPMVVLVNQYSASASEIVSGALKDQNRAKVVGERTFGKGSVQMLFPLSSRQAYLKLTTSHYYLPSGKCIHREENSQNWGVDPDLTIEMTPEQMRAAIDARQDLDVLRDAQVPDAPAQGRQEQLKTEAKDVKEAVAKATKDPMASDPQLSAALLLLRMQLVGAQL
ncbi:MAG: carboxyl-terminal processing protease [Phycisphaerales bacterium]|jgi:carboxyl-terminal processing protease|nr:carboxyl-terminal processing protease [Phycisphaerales bacterium]